jgi:hypothetical protein
MRLTSLWYFLSATILYALFKMLFDNILYAAIMARLKTSFGIEERDVIAIVATNLVPILATIVALAVIYFVSLHHHATKAKTANGAPVDLPPAPVNPKKDRLLGRLARLEPLPAITLGLAVALAAGVYWQIHYGPNRTAVTQTQVQRPSPDEIRNKVKSIDDIVTALDYIKQGAVKSHDLLEGWSYRITVDGPDAFMIEVGNIYGYFSGIGALGLSNAFKATTYLDIRQLATTSDMPDCSGKTLAFYSELKRIKEHKGADMVFILMNDTKLADWRAIIPECDKWATERLEVAKKKRTELVGIQ